MKNENIISYISEAWEIISSESIEKDELLVTGGLCKGSISWSFQNSKNFWVFIMSWVTQQAEIYQNFLKKRNRLLQKRNVIALILSKRVYINLVHEFLFFLVVWSQALKILACIKIGIKECYFLYIKCVFTCLMTIDLYCNWNKKSKVYKRLLLVQQQIMEPPVLFKFISIVNTPISRVNKN